MAFVKKVFYLVAVLGMSRVSCKEKTGQCSKQSTESSKFGMMLQRHTFKRMVAPSYVCHKECRLDLRCQSFNYVISKEVCELNNRTKEARPEDYVPDPNRYYFKRDMGRVPLGSIPELPAESCREIKASEGGQAVNGTYWFDFIVPDKVALAYCDMKNEDLDECNSSIPVCHVSATCQNTIGSYRCLCSRTGFIYRDGKGCVDADECTDGSHDCDVNADCNNTVGSYTCSCKPTYFGNGKYCASFRGLGSSVILGDLDRKNYTEKLISFFEPVLLSSQRSWFVRCWHAKTDGSIASTFHDNCDGKGPTVTIIKYGNYIFGGYTDVSWHSTPCDYSTASEAFIFSLYNTDGYNPVKLTQYRNRKKAMYGCSNNGPTFGNFNSEDHDIYISDNALSNQNSFTRCGSTYSVPPGYSAGDCRFFVGAAEDKFTPTDIEVFFEIGDLGASAILGSLDYGKYLGKLISYLDPVVPNAFRSEFVRCWHAKTDGSAASTFHSNCDGKGPTVTIIKSGSYIFGGYTDLSWQSSCGYSSTSKAFLFSLYNKDGYNPAKLTQYQNQHLAMYRCSTYGPTFGHFAIYISNNALSNSVSHTNCGYAYSVPTGYSAGNCGFFTGGYHFTPTDIEVFYEIGGLGSSVILGDLDHDKYLMQLITYLDPALPSASRNYFVRCWHAKTDGSAASTFHSNCDGKGPTVTIIKVGQYIFGGYTDTSWQSSCGYSSASEAFLFSLYNKDGYNPVKLTQYQHQHLAMYRCSAYGPTFGNHAIHISNNPFSNSASYTNCGYTYSVPTGYSAGNCGFFTGGYHFTPTDIEVFYEIGGLATSAILGSLDHSQYLGKLLTYLDPVLPSVSRSYFVRCWRARTDGSAASTFHSNCDGKGPTVTIIRAGLYIFGGYTDVSWRSSCGYYSASKAFIFSLYNKEDYNPVKLTQFKNQQYAMYSCSNSGPRFGIGHDIYISGNALSNSLSYTKCGNTYSVPTGYSAGICGFFTGGQYFTPTDIEVFYEIGLSVSVILGGLDYNKYLGKLLSFLDPVLLSSDRGRFVRCWHAKTDGSAASIFHNNCDGKGPTVTIIKYGSYIFGGYTDVSWHSSSCGYAYASKAFLFSLYNVRGYNPVKLTQYQNKQYAMYRCSSYGPTFGAGNGHHDMRIVNNALTTGNSYTTCGATYSVPTGYSAGDCRFFTGVYYFTPTDIEVFYEMSD